MSSKNEIEINIGGKVIVVSGEESQSDLRQISEYLNKKIDEFGKNQSYQKLGNDMRQILIQLNIASDYIKIKQETEELYNIKHELVETKQELIDTKQDVSDLSHKLIAADVKYQNVLGELNQLKMKNETNKK